MHAASYLLCKLLWRWSLGKIMCVGEQSWIFCKHIGFIFRFCVKASEAMDRHLLCLTILPGTYRKKRRLLLFVLKGDAVLLRCWMSPLMIQTLTDPMQKTIDSLARHSQSRIQPSEALVSWTAVPQYPHRVVSEMERKVLGYSNLPSRSCRAIGELKLLKAI